ncbi:MAG: helix-turn-helix domain-containing protein [Deltaproteobacteria bacterium]|jgi:transcriptional regulator with XRE-family HTH domain|nr:helix-turn-helix domain-containing protein [Deltaproteobacteria bacterium]
MIINGEAFREARLNKLMSKLNLASSSGVSPNIIKNIELGKSARPDLVRKVVLALGLTVEEAFDKKMVRHG